MIHLAFSGKIPFHPMPSVAYSAPILPGRNTLGAARSNDFNPDSNTKHLYGIQNR
jgi:hypothetical protein